MVSRFDPQFRASLEADPAEIGYLVEIDSYIPIRASTFRDVEWNGKLFSRGIISGLMRTDVVSYAPGATLVLQDPDYSLTASIASHPIDGVPVKIYLCVDFDLTVEPRLDMFGFASVVTTTDTGINITVSADNGSSYKTPRQRVTRDLFPDLLPPGAVVEFSGWKMQLAARYI